LPESKMKRVLFAAAALAVLSIGANARDDQLPTKFVGNWCFAAHTADHLAFYRRGRCANPDNIDDWLTINLDSFDVHQMHCQVLVARASKRGGCSDVWEMRVQGRPIHNGALSVRLVRRNCLS